VFAENTLEKGYHLGAILDDENFRSFDGGKHRAAT
jgi:hypothetical protein